MLTELIFNKSPNNSDSDANSNSLWHQITAIGKLYWYPEESGERAFNDVIRSWGMLALLLLLIVSLVSLTAFNSFVMRFLIDVIEDRDLSKFASTLALYAAGIAGISVLTGFSTFVRRKIALDWYEWLNSHIFGKYFKNQAYYKINFDSSIDNPDQRLAQEIEPIARTILSFSATCLEKILEMAVFIVILWQISETIGVIVIVYTIVGNLIALYLGQELSQINQEQLEFEADYNYDVTHVRNHAESIAFFQGEAQESNILQQRFKFLISTALRKIDWQRNQQIFNRGYQGVIQIFPFLVVAPLYISGEIDFGELNQASLACSLFATAMANLIGEVSNSGRLSNLIERLATLSDALEIAAQESADGNTIKIIEENRLAFDHITLQTPNYEKVIVEDLNVEVPPEQGLLIVGPSGRGKSSLLRAIAGLWNSGRGELVRPERKEILFLPQRPYLILGTLREQLLYPNLDSQMSDQELEAILQQVNLDDVLSRVGGFDEEVPWENILSLGEQQRLAFARILVSHPQFIILDEATSALDLVNEETLYKQLQDKETTFISVGHRESLYNYHQSVLELLPDSNWQLVQQKAN